MTFPASPSATEWKTSTPNAFTLAEAALRSACPMVAFAASARISEPSAREVPSDVLPEDEHAVRAARDAAAITAICLRGMPIGRSPGRSGFARTGVTVSGVDR